MHSCYLSSLYWKIKQRRGSKKALIALARKILIIIYKLLKTGLQYDENTFEAVRLKQSERHKKRIIAEAKKLGLQIVEPNKTS